MAEQATRRRPGRPPKPDDELERAHIDVRISDELRRRIRVAAAQRDLSMGTWLKEAAVEKLAREEERG
jgi:predicted HicB family RNase H-like nuclease